MIKAYSGTEQEFKNLDSLIGGNVISLPQPIGDTNAYQIFLMCKLAIDCGIIDNNMFYDEMYSEAGLLYSKFKESSVHWEGSEYDCILTFLHNCKESEKFKKEVRQEVCEIFTKIALDLPSNIDDIVKYCIEDVEHSADQNGWSDTDVHIAFRRWCEGENRVD